MLFGRIERNRINLKYKYAPRNQPHRTQTTTPE